MSFEFNTSSLVLNSQLFVYPSGRNKERTKAETMLIGYEDEDNNVNIVSNFKFQTYSFADIFEQDTRSELTETN